MCNLMLYALAKDFFVHTATTVRELSISVVEKVLVLARYDITSIPSCLL